MNEDLLKGLYDQLAASDNVSGDFQSFVAKTQKDNGKGLYEFMQELEPSDVKYEDFAASLSAAKKKDGTTPSSASSGSQEPAPIAAIGTELRKEVVNSWDQAAYTGEKSLIKKLSSLPAQPAFEPEGWQDVAKKVSTPAPYTATGRDYLKDPIDAAEESRKGFEKEYDVRKAYQEGTGIQKANRAKENLNMRWEVLTMDAARANKSLEDKFGEDWQQRLEALGEEANRASQITEKDIAEYKKTRTKDEFEAWKASNEAVIDQYNAIVGSQEIKDLQGVNEAQKKVIEARKTLPEKFPELKLMERRQTEADNRLRMMISDSPTAMSAGALGELVSQTHRFMSRVGTGALSAVGNLPDAVGNFEGDIPVPKVMGNLFRGISDFADRQKLTEEVQNPVPSPLTRQLMESVVGFEGKNVVVKNGAVKAIRDDNGFIVKADPKFEERFIADGGLEKAQNAGKSYTGTGNAAAMFGNMAADMAVMLGASVAGGNPALIASSYALIQQDLAMEGKNDLGMTRAEAAQYAGASAGLQSLIESFVSPAKVREGGNVAIDALQEAFKLGRREVATMAGKAPLASLPYIFAAPAAKLALQMAGENSEEIAQNLADQEIRSAFNRNTASNLKVEEWDRSDYIDTIAMTTLLTGGLGLSGMGGSAQRYQQNALVKAVEKPELYNALVDDLAQKGGISFDDAQAQKALIAKLGQDASFFPADMSAEDKRKAITLQSLSIQAGIAAKQEGIPEFESAMRREAKKKYDEAVKEVLAKYSPERETSKDAPVTGKVSGVKKADDAATKLKEKMFPKAEAESVAPEAVVESSFAAEPVAEENLQAKPANETSPAPVQSTGSQIESAFSNMAAGVAEGANEMIERYAGRIAAGESADDVLKGMPAKTRAAIEAKAAEMAQAAPKEEDNLLKDDEYFHATESDELIFPSEEGYKSREGNNVVGQGMYFGKDKEYLTDSYGPNAIKVKLDIKNPLVIDNIYVWVDGREINSLTLSKEDIGFLKGKGYDGIQLIMPDRSYAKWDQTIVFDKSQVTRLGSSKKTAPKEEENIDPFAHLDTGIERLIPAEMMAGTNEVVFTETEADLASPERTVFSVAERLKADKDSAMDAIVNVGLNIARSSGVKIAEVELPGFAEFLANRFDDGSVGQAGPLAASDYLSRSVRDWALSRDAQEAEKLPLRARFQPETFMDRVASFFERGGRITPTTFGQHGDANTVRGEKAAQLNYFSNNGKALDLLIHDGTLGELDNGMDEQEAIQQVVDFINSNTKGPHTYIRDRVTEQEAEKYAAIRGEAYSEEELAALGRMENDEVAAMQEAAGVASEWTPAEDAAFEDYLSNFLNEDGNVDHDAVLESINGFDPNFLNLPENVQQQLAQLANDGSGRIESQGTTQTEKSGEGSESVERGEAREADVRGENETPAVNEDIVVEMNNAGLLSDEEAQDAIDYLGGDKTKEEAFELANSRVDQLVDAVEDVTPIVEEAKKNDPTGMGLVAPVIVERDGGSMVIGADIQRDVLIGMGGKWNKQMQGYFVPGKNKVQVLAALATDRIEERGVSDRATGLTKIFSRLGAARQARRLAKLLDSVEGLEAKVALLAKDKAGRALLASQEKLVRAISLLQKAFPNVEIVIDPERFRAELIKRGATPAQIERAGGFVSDDKVFLNANELSAETPVHEFGHIWNNWTKKNDRAKFDEGISQMVGSEYEAAVRADPMYSGLSDEDILEEALAMAIGEKGARFLDMTAFERFKEWLAEMWGAIASKLGVRAENMSVRDMADGIARRMLSGNEMLFDTKARIAELENEKVQFNFMGSKAKMDESVRADLLMAKEIENDFPADRVWAMTGWYRGVDGQWRRENPATDMKFKVKIEDGQSGLLGDFVEGSIFNLYPELARLPFRVGGDVSGEAHLDTKDGVPVELAISKGANIGVVAHEIQHFIQIKEGFAKGSPATDIEMTRQIVDQLEHYYESGVLLEADEKQGFAIGAQLFEALADPNQAYYASAGEVEARLVQKRMALKDERGWGVFPSQPVGIYDNHFVSDRGVTDLREFPTYDEAMAARKEGEVVAKLADRQSVMPLLMSDVAPEEQLVFGLGLRNQVVDSFAKTIEERNLDIPSEVQFHFLSGAIQATQAELAARAIIASEVKAKRITPTEDAVKKISDAFGFTDLQVREMWGEEVAREKSIANRFFVAAATFEESAGLAKDAMKKLDRWIKKYFYNNGLLPSGIYGRALQKNSAVEARLRMVRGALADLEKAAKKEAGNYKEDVRGLLDAYMKGEGLLPAEWVDTKIAATKLRNMIDAMSVDLVREAGMKGKINVTILENAGIEMSFMPKNFGVEDLAMTVLGAYADPETLNDLEPEQLALFKFFEKNTDPAYLQELNDGLANGDIVDLEKFDTAVAAAMKKMELAAVQTARVLKILEKNPYDRTKVETYILNKYLTEKKVAAGSYLYRSYAMNDDPNYVKSLMETPEGRKAFADARMYLTGKWQGEIDELETLRAESVDELTAHLARVDAELQKSLDKAKEKLEAAKPYTKRYADIKKVLDDSIFYALAPINEFLKKEDMSEVALAELAASVRNIIDLRLQRKSLGEKIEKRRNWKEGRIEQLARDIEDVDNRLSAILTRDKPVKATENSMLGAAEEAMLKEREDIDEIMRAAMGEYLDVRVNVAKSAYKLAHFIESQRLLNEIRDKFAYIHFFPDGQQKGNATHQLPKTGFGAMSGWWTTKDIYDEMKEWNEVATRSVVENGLARFISALKYGKTIWSPVTHARNFVGNVAVVAANGNYNHLDFGKSLDLVREIWHRPDAREYFQYLTEIGVIQGSAAFADIGEALNGISKGGLKAGMEKADQALGGWLFEKPEKFYAVEDDFWRVYSFHAEMNAYSKALYGEKFKWGDTAKLLENKNFKELAPRISEIIQNTMPTYARTARYVKVFRYLPIGGSFIHFPAEIWRTSKNIVELSLREMADPRLRGVGMRRLMSFGATMTALSVLVEYLSSFVIDDDKNDWLEYFVKPWQKYGTKLYTKAEPPVYDENHKLVSGGYEFTNLSFTNPYSQMIKPFNVMLTDSDKGMGEKSMDAFMEAGLESFLNDGLFFGPVFDVMNNQKDGRPGKEIWGREEHWTENWMDGIEYVVKSWKPGIAKLGQDIAKTNELDKVFDEKFSKETADKLIAVSDALGFINNTGYPAKTGGQVAKSFLGLQVETVDPYASAKQMFKTEVAFFIERSGSDTSTSIFNFNNKKDGMSEREKVRALEGIKAEYEKDNAVYQAHLAHASTLVKALVGLNVPEPEIDDILSTREALRGKAMKEKEVKAIKSGDLIPLDVNGLKGIRADYFEATGKEF